MNNIRFEGLYSNAHGFPVWCWYDKVNKTYNITYENKKPSSCNSHSKEQLFKSKGVNL